jgi:hypothetical protein
METLIAPLRDIAVRGYSFNQSPIEQITAPTGDFRGRKEGDYQVLRCQNISAQDVYTTIEFWEVGDLILRIGDKNSFSLIGQLLGGKSRMRDRMTVAVFIPKNSEVFTFAAKDYSGTTSLRLRVGTEFSTILDVISYYEFYAYPVLPKDTNAEYHMVGEIHNGRQRFVDFTIGGATITTPYKQQDVVHEPVVESAYTAAKLANGGAIHCHLVSDGGDQRYVALRVRPKPF